MENNRKMILCGAGGGGGNNLIRSIRKSGYPITIIGTNMDPYALAKSTADKNYLMPSGKDPSYVDKVNRIIEREGADLITPNNDTEVGVISENREKINCKTFLPSKEAVRACQDKLEFYNHCKKNGIPVAEARLVSDLDEVEKHFEELPGDKLWCKLRQCSGSQGSLPVNSPEQVKFWVEYWEKMRNIQKRQFLLLEYLPGRDFAFQSVWKDGELVIAKCCERKSYFFARNMPSNTSSTPQLAKMTKDQRVYDICVKAIKSLDPKPHGNFCCDLKENINGDPCMTEINIGRFFMITNIFDLTGKYNTAEMHLRSAFGDPLPEMDPYGDIDESVYMIRDLDTEPTIVTKEQLENSYEKI
ncbi:hypothetical protein ACFLQ2_04625 [archaeon]